MELAEPQLATLLITAVPPLIESVPVNVLPAESTIVPAPIFVSPCDPEITPERSSVPLEPTFHVPVDPSAIGAEIADDAAVFTFAPVLTVRFAPPVALRENPPLRLKRIEPTVLLVVSITAWLPAVPNSTSLPLNVPIPGATLSSGLLAQLLPLLQFVVPPPPSQVKDAPGAVGQNSWNPKKADEMINRDRMRLDNMMPP
jgi:hypothetical protein